MLKTHALNDIQIEETRETSSFLFLSYDRGRRALPLAKLKCQECLLPTTQESIHIQFSIYFCSYSLIKHALIFCNKPTFMVLFSISIIIPLFYFRNLFILIVLKVQICLRHSFLVYFFDMSYNCYNNFSLFYATFWCLPLSCL